MLRTPPYNDPVDEAGKKLSLSWLQWFDQLFKFLTLSVFDYTLASIQVPINGFTFNIPDKTQVITLDPLGALASGTIVMPPNPVDGQPIQVSSTAAIAALTVSPNTGQTIKNAPTSIAAGGAFSYYYHAATAIWYKVT